MGKVKSAGTPKCQPACHCREKPYNIKRKKSSFFLRQPCSLPPVPSLLASLPSSQLTEEKCSLLQAPAVVSQSRVEEGELGAERQ